MAMAAAMPAHATVDPTAVQPLSADRLTGPEHDAPALDVAVAERLDATAGAARGGSLPAEHLDEAVAGEGIRAILGVPLVLDGAVIGALLAVHRTVRPFPPAEVSLLMSFAAHAAVALENARLFARTQQALTELDAANRQVRAHAEAVEQAAHAHDALTDVLLRGGGVEEVAEHDEADDAVHGTLVVSEWLEPILEGVCWDDDGKSADPNLPNTRIKTKYGDMVAILYDETPKHKENFIKLAKEHFYDSTLFHRVIEGFMIQGGDPDSKKAQPGLPLGRGGPGYTVDAEFNPTFFHAKGALSAASTLKM